MTQQFRVRLQVDSTNHAVPLGAEVWLDHDCVLDTDHVTGPMEIDLTRPDLDGQHELRVVLKNKLPEHTRLDSCQQIVEDARLTVSSLCFDNIELKQIFVDQAVYEHSNNGATAAVTEKFYGEMGCNGQVILKFTTPVYLWLLENM